MKYFGSNPSKVFSAAGYMEHEGSYVKEASGVKERMGWDKTYDEYVEKYGEIGVAIFIGIPLPGSGVYTGSMGSYLLGVSKKDFIIACILGVLIAGTAVTLITLFGSGAWHFFLKT